jgi:predicted component of type VI protein secretion system
MRFQNPLRFQNLVCFYSNRIIQTRIFANTRPPRPPRSPPPTRPRKPPMRRPPPPWPPPPWSPPPRPLPPRNGPPPSRHEGPATPASADQIQTRIFLYGSDSGKKYNNSNTGRYRFPKILAELRAAVSELAVRKNARRMLAKNARKSDEFASHRFGIVVLKLGLFSK